MKGIYDTRIHLFSSNTDRFTKRHTCPGIFYTDAQGYTCFILEKTKHDFDKANTDIGEGFFLSIEGAKGTGFISTPDGSELSVHEHASHEFYNSANSDSQVTAANVMNNEFNSILLEFQNSLRCYRIVSLTFEEKRPQKAICKTVRVPFTNVPFHDTHLQKLLFEDFSHNFSQAG